ncbi:MAG TPA: TolC family protein [Flavisolibacter sp.]
MKLLIGSLLLLASCFPGLAQDKWDLRECVEYALKNNISVKQADLQTRFSELQLDLDKLARWPNATFQASTGYSFGLSDNPTTGTLETRNFFNTQFGLSTSVTLFNWFSQKYTIEASALSSEADKAQVKKVQDDIALNVAVGYLQALLAKQQVNIASIQVQQTALQLDITARKVRAGLLPELNASQLEAQLAADSSFLVTSQGTVEQLLLQLKALLNLDAAAPFDIETPPVELIPVESLADLQPEVVYSLAVVNLPQQRVNDLRVQAAQKDVLAARSLMYPTIAAFGGLNTRFVHIESVQETVFVPNKNTGAYVNVNGTNYNVLAPGIDVVSFGVTPFFNQLRNNFGQNIGLGVTVPIFNGGNLRGNWKRSILTVQQLQLQQQGANQTLKQDIYKAHTDAIVALQKFNASKRAVDAAEKAYNFAQKRYDVNLLSTFELINNQNLLLRARQDMLTAQFDFVFKMKLLEFYKGQGLKL